MARPRPKTKDNARRAKKRVSLLTQEKVTYVDYKDVNLLRRFQSERAKIRARRVTGNSTQQQKAVANAIKNAREMALLPYTNRVTQQRGGRRGDSRRSEEGAEDAADTGVDAYADGEEFDTDADVPAATPDYEAVAASYDDAEFPGDDGAAEEDQP